MRRHCSSTASTHNNHTNIVLVWAKVDRMCPPHEACMVQDMFCFAALANATLGMMYTNITSAFPVWSFKIMCVVPMEITYMDTEDKYKYMVSKIHIFKVHIFKLHILYLKISKIHISKSIEVSNFFLGLA
jgi:hypothetical protein